MKTLKTLFITLLSFILILTPVSVSATSIATPTTTPLPIKLPANVTKADVIKRMRVVGAELAIHIAIQQLLKGVDYVMDPENNRAKVVNRPYCEHNGGPCVTDLAEAEAVAVTVPYATNLIKWQYTFLGCEWQNSGHDIHCTFEKNGDRRGVFFHSRGASGASYDRVADQVFANVQKGDKIALDHLQSIADEKAREEGKPTTEPKPTAPPTVKPDEKPKADEDAKPKEESKPEEKEKDKEKEEDKKKKCLPVTEPNIRMVLEPTTELTAQDSVSLAKIKGMVTWIENGGATSMDPIRVYENYLIVNGNHRFIAMKLCRMNAPRINWAASQSDIKRAYPIKNIRIDESWYGD